MKSLCLAWPLLFLLTLPAGATSPMTGFYPGTASSAPESLAVSIVRDAFGKPNAITRAGTWAGSGLSATRRYGYDAHQRLCKTIEPETGATIQAYNAAGNLAWRASGQSSTSTAACD